MIVRSINDKHFDRFLKDFKFLFSRIRDEKGELDLRLRNDYFNLYYKGNSLAKVRVEKVPYKIMINSKFTHEGLGKISDSNTDSQYYTYSVSPDYLHSFFSKVNIQKSLAAIKKEHYNEELSLEQMLIADNLNRNDFFVIDRQVQGGALGGSRIDLLALRRQLPEQGNDYQFLIIEIKLGNNPELYEKVGVQLKKYKDIFIDHFDEFKECYERTYYQMKQTGVLSAPSFETVNIVLPVDACVVVFGYPGKARDALDSLSEKYSSIPYKQFRLEMLSLDELKPKLIPIKT